MVCEFGEGTPKGKVYAINPAMIIVLVPMITAATSSVDPLIMIHWQLLLHIPPISLGSIRGVRTDWRPSQRRTFTPPPESAVEILAVGDVVHFPEYRQPDAIRLFAPDEAIAVGRVPREGGRDIFVRPPSPPSSSSGTATAVGSPPTRESISVASGRTAPSPPPGHGVNCTQYNRARARGSRTARAGRSRTRPIP